MDFSLLLSSYATVWSNPEVLLMTFIGALGGVLLGAIPGMTATMGVALLIPFSFGMDLIPSIGLLLGIYCGGMYGGSISASATPEYQRYIEDMRNSFDQLDEVIAEINSQCEDGKSLDDTRVKAIFYALYFAAEQPGADGIRTFADCFVDYEERTRTVTTTDEEGNEVETTETYMVAVPIEDLSLIHISEPTRP